MTEESWEIPVLEQLGSAMVHPPTPDLRPAVLARIVPSHRSRAPLRASIAVVAALVVGVLLTILVSREARDAIAGFLGLSVEGEHIEVAPASPAGQTPTALPGPLGPAKLGERVSRAEAVALAGFEPRFPPSFGEPHGYYVIFQNRNVVIADYGELQIWEFPLDTAAIAKLVFVSGATIVSEQMVNDRPGYWITGGERLVTVENGQGTPIAETQRMATGNALVWAEGGLYYRIEGVRSLEEALRIAEQLR